jgi:hypothetical protein
MLENLGNNLIFQNLVSQIVAHFQFQDPQVHNDKTKSNKTIK